MEIRHPAVADMFYPGKSAVLRQQVSQFLEQANPPNIGGRIKGLIAPHAGYVYSGPVAAYAYKSLENLDREKDWKILLLGPSHQIPFSGAAVSEFEEWETPLGNVKVGDIREKIKKTDLIKDIPGADSDEHSLEVQIPFLQTVLQKFTIYPLVLGSVNSRLLAEELAEFCKEDDVLTVVSSDLSHYLGYEDAKETDFETCEAISGLDTTKMDEIGDACGKNAILTLMHIAKKLKWKCKMLNYRNSGDTAGDKYRVVGYGAYAFYK
ncbi:AmmeMemoRadiSam system protein B [Patescibacteria group bacterium]|nr:AmmeMemoRadiSam system protein B [Patescibacteria group bacterium]